jgi:hypothetical protein
MRRSRASADERPGRLRRLLDRLDVDYSTQDIEMVLNGIPPSEPPVTRPRLRTQPLHFPLDFAGRIAVLEGGFDPDRPNMRQFAGIDLEYLRQYQPEALVAPLGAALSLADMKHRGLFDLPSLTVAIVVLTKLDDLPLAAHHRDMLWRAFGVPVFEQVRGWDDAVIARECEVHDGLHIVESAAIPHLHNDELLVTQLSCVDDLIVRARTGLSAEIVIEHCECGNEAPRLRNLAPLGRRTAATV